MSLTILFIIGTVEERMSYSALSTTLFFGPICDSTRSHCCHLDKNWNSICLSHEHTWGILFKLRYTNVRIIIIIIIFWLFCNLYVNCLSFARLYDLAANADGYLAVFHPSYIDACLKTGDMRKVCIGDYYLPPAGMYEGNIEFDW